MIVKVHSQHFDLTPSIKRFVKENLTDHISEIWRKEGASLDVELRDIRGGDKQGIDKQCRCVFQIPEGRQIVITELTEDMRTSIHQARKRLVRRIRTIAERRTTARRPTKYFVAAVAQRETPRPRGVIRHA